ncbi:MAG: hypothetical protein ACRYFX_19665 [Janthinobacterium lividum]
MATLTHLPGPEGKDNQPGLKQTVYIAPLRWFDVIKGFKTTTAAGDSVTIDGAHTFKANPATPGKDFGFLKAYATLDTAQLKIDPTGERDGRGAKASLEFFNPGNTKASAEFARQIKNESCLMLVKCPDGTVEQIGAEDLGAEIVGSYDSGKLSGGRKGTIYKAEAYQNGHQFYEGAIDLLPD